MPFKNKKQKISEHSSDVLNAIVLQTVDYAGSSTNIQVNTLWEKGSWQGKNNQYSKQPQWSGIFF